jgi:hypothetical protein
MDGNKIAMVALLGVAAYFGIKAFSSIQERKEQEEESLWISPEELELAPSPDELIQPIVVGYAPRTLAMAELPTGPPSPDAKDVLWLQAVEKLGSIDRWRVNKWWDRFSGNNALKIPYLDAIDIASKKYGVSTLLIYAVIAQESSGKPELRGSSGEYGLMQLMPGTAQMLGYTGDLNQLLTNPTLNIDLGTKYLKRQLDRYNRSIPDALAAYNAGTVYRMDPYNFDIVRYNGSVACPLSPYNYGQHAVQCIVGLYNTSPLVSGYYTNQAYPDGVLDKHNLFSKVVVKY